MVDDTKEPTQRGYGYAVFSLHLDEDGYVLVSQTPGLGLEYDWDYINENLVD